MPRTGENTARMEIPTDERVVVERFLEGESIKALGRAYAVRGATISALLVRAGVRRVGDKGYRFRLRPEQEAEVAQRYAAHEPTTVIGASFGIPTSTVRKIARRHDLAINPRGQQYRDFSSDEIREMGCLWQAGASQAHIGTRFGANQTVVSRVLRSAGYQPTTRHAQGVAHPNWRGGRAVHGEGYVWVRIAPHDPLAVMRNRAGYVLEHRLVLARALGRPLTQPETVHHINGVKADNRLANLQLRNGRHGNGTVLICGNCGSHNVVAQPLTEA